MSIFRYLLSHQHSDYGHNDYHRGAYDSLHRMAPPALPEAEKRQSPHCQSSYDTGGSGSQCLQAVSLQAAFCGKCGQPVQTSAPASG